MLLTKKQAHAFMSITCLPCKVGDGKGKKCQCPSRIHLSLSSIKFSHDQTSYLMYVFSSFISPSTSQLLTSQGFDVCCSVRMNTKLLWAALCHHSIFRNIFKPLCAIKNTRLTLFYSYTYFNMPAVYLANWLNFLQNVMWILCSDYQLLLCTMQWSNVHWSLL